MESPHFNTFIDPRQMAPLKERYARIKESTSPVLLQSGLDEKVVVRFYGMLLLSAKCPRPLGRWKTPYEKRLGEPFKGPIIFLGALVEYLPSSPKDQMITHQFGKKVLPGIFLGYELIISGWNLERRLDIEDLEMMDATQKRGGTLAPTLRTKATGHGLRDLLDVLSTATGKVDCAGGTSLFLSTCLDTLYSRPS